MPGPPALLRWLDLPALLAALPVFVVAGLPFEAYVVGGGAWIAQRAIQLAVKRRADASEDPRTIVGLTAAGMIARGWLVAISVFLVGLSDDEAGLAAAVLLVALFTIYFSTQLITRPFEDRRPRT